MRKYTLLLILCLFVLQLVAQKEKESRENYQAMAGSYAAIYTGKEHQKYPAYIKGHPFLVDENYTKGTLMYDGILYTDIQMRLDQYTMELVLQSPNQKFNIILQPDLFDYADIHNYRVIYHRPDRFAGSPSTGYLLSLYESENHRVLERRTTNLEELIKDRDLERSFIHSIRYYIFKDNKYYSVKRKGSVLGLFKDRKRELNQFIKQNKLDFKNNTGEAIVRTVEEYEKLAR